MQSPTLGTERPGRPRGSPAGLSRQPAPSPGPQHLGRDAPQAAYSPQRRHLARRGRWEESRAEIPPAHRLVGFTPIRRSAAAILEAGGVAEPSLTTSAFCASASLMLKERGLRAAVPAAPAGESAPLRRPVGLGRCLLPPDRPLPSRGGPGLRQLPPRPRSHELWSRTSRLISRRPKSVRRAGRQHGSGRGVPGSHLPPDGPRPRVADPDVCQAPRTYRAADPGSALSDASHPTSILDRPLPHPGQSHQESEPSSAQSRQGVFQPGPLAPAPSLCLPKPSSSWATRGACTALPLCVCERPSPALPHTGSLGRGPPAVHRAGQATRARQTVGILSQTLAWDLT